MTVAEPPTEPSLPGGPLVPDAPVAPRARPAREGWRAAVGRAFWKGFVPFLATVAILHFLIPTRMEGGDHGLSALLARLGDEHPLILGVAVFLSLSAVAQYWFAYLRPARADSAHALPDARSIVGGRRRGVRFGIALLAVAVLALGLRTTVVEVYRVVSPSMMPTLNPGDRLIVNRLAYGLRVPFSDRILRARLPRRGDLVVFSSQAAGANAGPTTPRWLVKRVIGLPGDVVSFRSGFPIVNRWVVPSCDAGPFASTGVTTTVRGRLNVELMEDRSYLTVRMPLDGTVLEDYRVPPGEVFVMGDDRAQSSDSRNWNQGTGGSVPVRSIVGRVSRLAVGAFHDGRIDWRTLLSPLRLRVREPRVDLRKTEENITGCLHAPRPPSLWAPPPPPPAPLPTGSR